MRFRTARERLMASTMQRREVNKMKIITEGEPDEIAALVLAIQGRREFRVELKPDRAKIIEAGLEAIRDTPEVATS